MTRWDDGDGVGDDSLPTRRQLRDQHRHPLLRRAGIVAVIVVVALVSVAAVAVWQLNSNVKRIDVSQAIGSDRPTPTADVPADQDPLNILVLGSDTRAGLSTDEYGTDAEVGGAHADTSILIHISADRQSVLAVSIPRDSMTRAPRDCDPNAPKDEWVMRQWNANFNMGGVGCSIKTLEGLTGVFIEHYAIINFDGFADMVDALGGVEVCTPTPIDDSYSGLTLPAGNSTLEGRDALAYVRLRHSVGDGSDIGRIKRQQAFMSSVAQKAVSTQMLARPDKLYSFLNAATKALTTDPQFGVGAMGDAARSLQNVGPENIQFVTVPVEEYPPDHNRVQWTENAELVWAAIREDRGINEETAPEPTPDPATTGSPSPSATALTVRPDRIAVHLLNGSGVKGLAGQAAEALRIQGFLNVDVGDAPAPATGVVIEHSRYQAAAARTVAAAFPGAVLRENNAMGDVVQVTLGTGAPAVVEIPNRLGTDPLPEPSITATVPATPAPSATLSGPEIETRTADQSICS